MLVALNMSIPGMAEDVLLVLSIKIGAANSPQSLARVQ
jgi:hypothetical protein